MAWGSSRGSSEDANVKILREGMVQLLQTLAAGTGPSHSKEILNLSTKLKSGRVPSGLNRELARLFGKANKKDSAAETFADTARAMGDAMARVAMSEPSLEHSIQQFQALVPLSIQPDDALFLASKARALEESAIPIRRRVLNAQGETALILEAVSYALAGTESTSGKIATKAGKLARTFAENHDDVALKAMRGQITKSLKELAADAGQLESRMSNAKARTQDLERRVEKQAAILGVLDSCRRIRKELERYGDDKNKPITPLSVDAGLWDTLTGVYSRETYERLVERACQAADGLGRPLSLVYVEVNNLQKLSENNGTAARDTVLKTLARQLTEIVQDTDVLSRIGEDRFALLLPATPLKDAQARATQARAALSRVAFASRAGRFHATLRASAVERKTGETPNAFGTRAAHSVEAGKPSQGR